MFLMPLIFSKISFNTFLLFLIPVIFVLVMPYYYGTLGAASAIDRQENRTSRKNSIESIPFSLWLLWIFACLYLLLPNEYHAVLIIFTVYYYINCIILIYTLGLNSSVLRERKAISFQSMTIQLKNIFFPKNIFRMEIIRPCFWPSFVGILSILAYYFVLNNFLDKKTTLITSLFAPVISSISFYLSLKKDKWIAFVIIVLSMIIITPRLLFSPSVSKAYFHWAHYGQITVHLIPPGTSCKNFKSGTILFNSGSELYVSLDSKQKGAPVLLYLKKGKCSEKISPNQIIRIPYKDLETIPLDLTSP